MELDKLKELSKMLEERKSLSGAIEVLQNFKGKANLKLLLSYGTSIHTKEFETDIEKDIERVMDILINEYSKQISEIDEFIKNV